MNKEGHEAISAARKAILSGDEVMITINGKDEKDTGYWVFSNDIEELLLLALNTTMSIMQETLTDKDHKRFSDEDIRKLMASLGDFEDD